MTIVIAVLAALLVLGVTENMLHRRALERIPIRILVNGTRGKTTVTRTIAAALNAAGIRTYAKTTGSEARRIDPDGTETEYRAENRPVSIMEQLPFVRLAVRGKAQAIVVECMAQRIENQFLMADKLIRPQYVVITNAYVDHAGRNWADGRRDGAYAGAVHPRGELRDCARRALWCVYARTDHA